MDNNCGNSSAKVVLANEFCTGVSLDGGVDSQSVEYKVNQPKLEETSSENTSHPLVGSLPSATTAFTKVDASGTPVMNRRSVDKQLSRKSNKVTLNKGVENLSDSSDQASMHGVSSSPLPCNTQVKEASMRHKVLNHVRCHIINVVCICFL